MGLVFRENKFASIPELPFASLALPSFGNLPSSSSYIDIDGNQFVCDCHSIGWFLAFGKLGFNSQTLANIRKVAPRDEANFIDKIYASAGQCLQCHPDGDCQETPETVTNFAASAIKSDPVNGDVSCYGVAVKNHDIALGSAATTAYDEVKNGKLVNTESAERLTERLILMNDCMGRHSFQPYLLAIIIVFRFLAMLF